MSKSPFQVVSYKISTICITTDFQEIVMSKSIAIVGASANRAKYGNKAVRAFVQGGWTIYPVNARESEVEGLQCYASIAEVPGPLDRISMYVPPTIGMTMLDEIAKKTPTEFFLNPGSESPELIEAARTLGLNPIQACSVVNIGLRPEMFPDE
jgi:uncharacterized protein